MCAETGDFVQLLGGNGIDTSKLLPITDLCVSFTGPSKFAPLAVLPCRPRCASDENNLSCSSPEGRLRQHGGQDGVQREVRQPGVVQLQATGQSGAADHQTQQRGGFLLQQVTPAPPPRVSFD